MATVGLENLNHYGEIERGFGAEEQMMNTDWYTGLLVKL